MKIRTKKSQLKASRIFTDREEPRAAFWQQYRRLEEEIAQEEANVHVLTYYGIGGIGKSSLLKKIMEEMDEGWMNPCVSILISTCSRNAAMCWMR